MASCLTFNCTVSLVVMRLSGRDPRTQWQLELSAIKSLNLTFLVYRKYDRFVRWIHIKADHVPQLLVELRILAELEALCDVRLQLMVLPDANHG